MKSNDRYNLVNYGLKQSNSLQNLLDDSHYQLNSHQSHQSGKKHHQKNRKNSTSVSARRLEGGSLPIDMHHSSTAVQSSDQPFLREYKFKNRKQKESDIETDERKLMQRHFENKDVSFLDTNFFFDFTISHLLSSAFRHHIRMMESK